MGSQGLRTTMNKVAQRRQRERECTQHAHNSRPEALGGIPAPITGRGSVIWSELAQELETFQKPRSKKPKGA